MRMKIARKEAKETEYWLNLVIEANMDLKEKIVPLVRESIELKKILSAIITKSSNK